MTDKQWEADSAARMSWVKASNDSIPVKLSCLAGQCKGAWSAKDAELKEETGVVSCGHPVSTFTGEGTIRSCLWCLDSRLFLEHPVCRGDRQAACQEEGQTLEAPARHFHQASNLTAERSAVFSALSFLFSKPTCCLPQPSPSLQCFTGQSWAENIKYATSSQTLE